MHINEIIPFFLISFLSSNCNPSNELSSRTGKRKRVWCDENNQNMKYPKNKTEIIVLRLFLIPNPIKESRKKGDKLPPNPK